MPRVRPVLGYPTQADACVALRAQGLSDDEIATMIGRDPVHVRASLSSRDYAKTPRKIVLPMELAAGLQDAAEARGIGVPDLVLRLLETIVRDEVIDALLGEPGEGDV